MLRRQAVDDPAEHRAAHLGAAAPAAHGQAGKLADGVGICDAAEVRAGLPVHLRQVVEALHEATIDPVLPGPQQSAFPGPVAARGHGIGVAGADQAEEVSLRSIWLQRATRCRAAQVFGQDRALADGEHTRLGPRVGHGGNVTGGENLRVGNRAQFTVDSDKTLLVHRESRLRRPFRRGGIGHPEHGIGGVEIAAFNLHAIWPHADHFAVQMHGDAALTQHTHETAAHPGIVSGEDLRPVCEQRVVQA